MNQASGTVDGRTGFRVTLMLMAISKIDGLRKNSTTNWKIKVVPSQKVADLLRN
jgi:hypothetical protein